MDEGAAQGTEEITYHKSTFDDLKIDTFVLIYIITNAKLKIYYAQDYEIDKVGGNDLEVTKRKTVNSSKSKFVLDQKEKISLSKITYQTYPSYSRGGKRRK